ncbi:PREDICTED: protein lethal(2)essential for life-like isoform X1 [Trachymyrmex septentrionalis]|uniref:protein lethal(2)essential for life-like isoform X1 n=1 Tax=Trachymyrmex septentrionalis TaxID=34720 RepID=UPI00084EF0F5|nr:PREDICTED: protein lethal(2)essential for life-like isoform X1 [Trachymyrmex septentrionalis]
MSIVPLVFRNWWDDFDRPVSRLLDQHFGIGLHRDDLISSLSGLGLDRPSVRFGNRYYRPWGNVTRQNSSGTSTIQLDNDNFQVILDVQQFSPDEITVKTIDNHVVVEAKHEEKQDEHGYISRHFVRRYVLPPSHDLVNITSTLSLDGVLTVTAPKKVRSIEPRQSALTSDPLLHSRIQPRTNEAFLSLSLSLLSSLSLSLSLSIPFSRSFSPLSSLI